jgi:hypothetical protein
VASERNEMVRAHFQLRMGANYTPEQLVFLDESAKDERTVGRKYGWSMRNTLATVAGPFIRGDRWSILPMLTTQGIIEYEIIRGSFTKDLFRNFVITKVVCLSFVEYTKSCNCLT